MKQFRKLPLGWFYRYKASVIFLDIDMILAPDFRKMRQGNNTAIFLFILMIKALKQGSIIFKHLCIVTYIFLLYRPHRDHERLHVWYPTKRLFLQRLSAIVQPRLIFPCVKHNQ